MFFTWVLLIWCISDSLLGSYRLVRNARFGTVTGWQIFWLAFNIVGAICLAFLLFGGSSWTR